MVLAVHVLRMLKRKLVCRPSVLFFFAGVAALFNRDQLLFAPALQNNFAEKGTSDVAAWNVFRVCVRCRESFVASPFCGDSVFYLFFFFLCVRACCACVCVCLACEHTPSPTRINTHTHTSSVWLERQLLRGADAAATADRSRGGAGL